VACPKLVTLSGVNYKLVDIFFVCSSIQPIIIALRVSQMMEGVKTRTRRQCLQHPSDLLPQALSNLFGSFFGEKQFFGGKKETLSVWI